MIQLQPDKFALAMNFSSEIMGRLKPLWAECIASCPENGAFLPLVEVEKWYLLSGADMEFLPELRHAWERCRNSPELRLYGWILVQGLLSGKLEEAKLPLPEMVLKERAGCFFLLLTLSLYPEIEKLYREKGIPQKYVHACASSLPGLMSIYHTANPERQGVFPIQFAWMTYFLHGTMFRIGRLEYLVHPRPAFVPAIFRSRKTGKTVALCPENWELGEDGFLHKNGWHPELVIAENTVTGIPVSPCGKALIHQRVTLDLREFERIDQPGDIIPSCHIPAGGGLTTEKVLASLREAVTFFRQYLQIEIRIFCCDSWILSPEWEQILPDSNIAKFQRLVYRTPWYSRGTDGMFFLFGCWDTDDWRRLPVTTSLQRAYVKQHFAGGRIGTGGMFLLVDDLQNLQENWYLTTMTHSF